MSQSDYIKYKRVATILRKNDQPPVMESQTYLDLKEFALVNTIVNTKPVTNLLTLPTTPATQIIFDMAKVVNNCPTFPICTNTNTRKNRVPLSTVYYTPVPKPLSIKATKNASWMKNACKCKLNSKYTNSNICSCKNGLWGIVR
jgi:hypothetical protein